MPVQIPGALIWKIGSEKYCEANSICRHYRVGGITSAAMLLKDC